MSRIEPHAVYSVAEAGQLFGLPKSALSREIRAGRLRVSKRRGKYFVLGAWLLEWIEAGEVHRGRTDRPQVRAA